MGLARAEQHEGARSLIAHVGEQVGIDAFAVLARGGPALRRQDVLQPLTMAVSLGSVLDVPDLDLVAGHSLGELGAIALAGGVAPTDALNFSAARGRLMGTASRERPGGIVAVRGTETEVRALLAGAPELALAARNSDESWSLCGPPLALARLAMHTRTTPVTNAGAWHHPGWESLAGPLSDLVSKMQFTQPKIEVLSAHTRVPVTASTLPELLLAQVWTPVDWYGVVRRMVSRGVREVVVAEPSRQLVAIVREVEPSLRVFTTLEAA